MIVGTMIVEVMIVLQMMVKKRFVRTIIIPWMMVGKRFVGKKPKLLQLLFQFLLQNFLFLSHGCSFLGHSNFLHLLYLFLFLFLSFSFPFPLATKIIIFNM